MRREDSKFAGRSLSAGTPPDRKLYIQVRRDCHHKYRAIAEV